LQAPQADRSGSQAPQADRSGLQAPQADRSGLQAPQAVGRACRPTVRASDHGLTGGLTRPARATKAIATAEEVATRAMAVH